MAKTVAQAGAMLLHRQLNEVAEGTALSPVLRKFMNNPDSVSPKELLVVAMALLNRAKVNSKASELSRIDSRIPHVIEMIEKIHRDI